MQSTPLSPPWACPPPSPPPAHTPREGTLARPTSGGHASRHLELERKSPLALARAGCAAADGAGVCGGRPAVADAGGAPGLRLAAVPAGRHGAGVRAGLRTQRGPRGDCRGDRRQRAAEPVANGRHHRSGDRAGRRIAGAGRRRTGAALRAAAADAVGTARHRALLSVRRPRRMPGQRQHGDPGAGLRGHRAGHLIAADLADLVDGRCTRHADRRAGAADADRPASRGLGAASPHRRADAGHRDHAARGHHRAGRAVGPRARADPASTATLRPRPPPRCRNWRRPCTRWRRCAGCSSGRPMSTRQNCVWRRTTG